MEGRLFKYVPLTTLFVVYLYCCGSLYLIGYWGTFNINFTSFVSITEIPKYFVFPFVVSNVMFGIVLLLLFFLLRIEVIDNKLHTQINPPNTKLGRFTEFIFSFDVLLIIMLVVGYFIYERFKLTKTYWLFISVETIICLSAILGKTDLLIGLSKKSLWRAAYFSIIIGCPILSFSTGKIASIDVYQNKNIRYVNIFTNNSNNITNRSNSLKLLGLLSDKAIVSSLNNDSIIIVNQSSIQQINVYKAAK